MLPERAEGLRTPPRPGPAGQRPAASEDVLHVARRDPRGQLVPGLPERASTRRASCWPTTPAAAVDLIKEVNPRREIVVWSDMFDPNHNAVDKLLPGQRLAARTRGRACRADVIIANWNGGKAAESLKWFADRGHRQVIAGYYDGDDLYELQAMGRRRQGRAKSVSGFMYTTWRTQVRLLETYGKAIGAAK